MWRRLVAVLERHSLFAFRPDSETAHRTEVLLTAFYAFVLLLAMDGMRRAADMAEAEMVRLLWPLSWAQGLAWRPLVIGISALFGLAGLVGLLLPYRQVARIFVFVALLQFSALTLSFGRINHEYHHVLIPALFLALMPYRSGQGVPRPIDCSAIFAAQATVMLTYSLSGFWKLQAGVQQLLSGGGGLFSGRSLSTLVAARALQTAEDPPLVGLAVSFPRVSAVLFLITVFIEFTALAAVFFPRVAAAWALGLALFHVGVMWSMNLHFSNSAVVLLLLFFLSPFLPHRISRGDGAARTDRAARWRSLLGFGPAAGSPPAASPGGPAAS